MSIGRTKHFTIMSRRLGTGAPAFGPAPSTTRISSPELGIYVKALNDLLHAAHVMKNPRMKTVSMNQLETIVLELILSANGGMLPKEEEQPQEEKKEEKPPAKEKKEKPPPKEKPPAKPPAKSRGKKTEMTAEEIAELADEVRPAVSASKGRGKKPAPPPPPQEEESGEEPDEMIHRPWDDSDAEAELLE